MAKTKNKDKYFEAVGKRKGAVARVRLYQNDKKGTITANEKKLTEYFPREDLQDLIKSPLKKTATGKNFHVNALVSGGGIKGQAEAVRLGISRALLKFNPDFRQTLKEAGFLTRDSRVKERRKFGLKKARKAPQWSKR